MIKEFLIFIPLLSIVVAQNSCSDTWQYVRQDDTIQGLITILFPRQLPKYDLKITLYAESNLMNKYIGEVNLVKDRDLALGDAKNGIPVQYNVKFPIISPLPKLASIHTNGQLYCSGEQKSVNVKTTIYLDHSLVDRGVLGGNQGPSYQNVQVPQVENTYRPPPPPPRPSRPISQPQIPSPQYPIPSPSVSNAECGVPDVRLSQHTGLVINGRMAQRGNFPWLVSQFYDTGSENIIICGGSLISSSAVITAAHCIQNKQSQALSADKSSFYIGKYNLNDGEQGPGYVIKGRKFIVHPEWDPYSNLFDADIAIAILSRHVQFSQYVKPICLWKNTDYRDIVGKKNGLIAGYGKTEHGSQRSDVPHWVNTPAVDDIVCLRSNVIFPQITSPRTFCIGSRDGAGPCNGDSGGGFIVEHGGKFYLRGIISASTFTDSGECDTKNYALCTNVAYFYSWITSNI